MGSDADPPKYTLATEHALNKTPFFSIEYPGYIGNNETSISRAIENLGGLDKVEASFRSSSIRERNGVSNKETSTATTTSTSTAIVGQQQQQQALIPLELHFRPGNHFAHPVRADMVNMSGLVLKVTTRRKRKREWRDEEERMEIYPSPSSSSPTAARQEPVIIPEYTTEVIGAIQKTARFRSMADFQYQPDPTDRMVKLREAMDTMDARAIQQFTLIQESEDDSIAGPSNSTHSDNIQTSVVQGSSGFGKNELRLFPPPLFSRQTIPQLYNYKANPVSVVQTITDEATGEERQRYVNKNLWKSNSMAIISIEDEEIITKPTDAAMKDLKASNQDLIQQVKEHFEKRPVWSRLALFNQFSRADAKELQNDKNILASLCYGFRDGPHWGNLLRIGYDPRKTPDSYQYQRIHFRDIEHVTGRGGILERKMPKESAKESKRATHVSGGAYDEHRHPESHIFDGKGLLSDSTSFQICDITDPVLHQLLHDADARSDTFDPRSGWYIAANLDRIRALMRHKLFLLRSPDGLQVMSEEESMRWLREESDYYVRNESKTHIRAVPGGKTAKTAAAHRKRNRAKEQLSDAQRQAARIRAALERGDDAQDEYSGGGRMEF